MTQKRERGCKGRTIWEIVQRALCVGCGCCAGICPVNAIAMKENAAGFLAADLDQSICIECGKCFSICPRTSQKGGKGVEENGDILAGYVGYAADPEIRRNGQSGGVVTALLAYLLEAGEIEGAWVNRFSPKTCRPEVVFATSREEICGGAGSLYTQSSVGQYVLRKNESKRQAAVVLGCQAEGISHAGRRPEYLIGLFCAGQNNIGLEMEILNKIKNMKGSQTKDFYYRSKKWRGWPGDILIRTLQGDEYWFPKEVRKELLPLYGVPGCLTCCDKLNATCDIACGDPWGIPEKMKPEGYSVVLARTPKGETLLKRAMQDGVLILEPVSAERIIRGQNMNSITEQVEAAQRYFAGVPLQTPKDKPIYQQAAYAETLFKESREGALEHIERWRKKCRWQKTRERWHRRFLRVIKKQKI